MLKRFASLALIMTLACSVGGISVLANTTKTDNATESLAEPTTPVKSEVKPNEKLRAAVTKLVADAKAGKANLAKSSQMQPAKSNGLSKGKKIALGVGIAVVVVAVIVVIHAKNHLFDDFNLSNGR